MSDDIPEDNVQKFPGEFSHYRILTGAELQKFTPTDLMVWEVCKHTPKVKGARDGKCHHCPAYRTYAEAGIGSLLEEDDEDKVYRGCRIMAEDICRVVLAAKAHEDNKE